MNFDSIFLKFGKLTSNYITKLSTYARHNYEIFENFGAMLIDNRYDTIPLSLVPDIKCWP